ncbi:DUF3824 domain-containing protein [Gordonia alkaliphila]|uniref:DUF3824 domain-containing protein n=1 Tax=Gordonia alkaliphila TaxID=1053547 RepID=UPI001FF33510|nr:DUF3824 domain-containing protein [Gordonia alkaliphila]MCK0440019.1 DUF3824 domain-containing protein [Gordonia alkaliphila]
MSDSDEWRPVPPEDTDPTSLPDSASVPDPAVPEQENPYASQPYAPQPYAIDPSAHAYGVPPQHHPLLPVPSPPSLSAAFSWAWRKFSAHAGVIVGAAALWAAVLVAVLVALWIVATAVLLFVFTVGGGWSADSLPTVAVLTTSLVLGIVLTLVGAIAVSCWLNALIVIADGRRPELADFGRPAALGPIMAISVVIGVISVLLDVLFVDGLDMEWASWIVTLVISFGTLWMLYQAADARLSTAGAVRTGLDLSMRNPAATLIVLVVTTLIGLAGILALVVGLLVALPVSGLFALYYFRALTGRPIAA